LKVRVLFKTPDAVSTALEDLQGIRETDRDGAIKTISRFVRYGEIVTIEFDTDAGTATVLPA
jgi:hypothetical protein